MRSFLFALSFVSILGLMGCAETAPIEPKRIEEIRPYPPAFKSMSYTIQRRDLQAQLSRRGDNAIRLVPVFQSAVSPDTHVYRVFDIRPKGVYSLLGIQNSDIIVAADGFLIRRPEQFAAYVELLQNEDIATVEIQRNGEALLLKYAFVPALRTAPEGNPPQPKSAQAF